MTDVERLIAAKRAADDELAAAEDALVADLVAAKDAYRTDPTDGNRAAKDTAVTAVQEVRHLIRSGRQGLTVGGDAVRSDDTTGGV